jgi:ATP-dependent Clp protease ATP-binding subunit ClpA
MYERFTDRARKVMQLANQEAQRLYHEYVGTEHVLLGLLCQAKQDAIATHDSEKVTILRDRSDRLRKILYSLIRLFK